MQPKRISICLAFCCPKLRKKLNAMDIGNIDDDQSKAVMLFGRDIRKIPCFRDSQLYGIYSGFATGLGTFMFTSRVKLATVMSLGSYFCVSIVYFCFCRYNYTMTKWALADVQSIMRQRSIDIKKEVDEEQNGKIVDA